MTTDLLDRLADRIDFDGPDGCWLWTGKPDTGGYGIVGSSKGNRKAHRVVYETVVGPVEAPTLDPLCRVRLCVNPDHLEPVTQRENSLRGTGAAARHAQQTHCKRGHEFTPENTIREKSRYGTVRRCRACKAEQARGSHNRPSAVAWREQNRERLREYWREYNRQRRG